MIQTILLPVILLGVSAWMVPWLLSRIMPEGVVWLAVIGAVSAGLLAALSAFGFYVLYGPAGETVLDAALWHFVVLSARAALIWGPVLVLSLANLPKSWKTAVW